MKLETNPFDRGSGEAADYDSWYDSPIGRGVLESERRCVVDLLAGAHRPWLDLGTGTGRFGGTLGADIGLDPALSMLGIASRRMPTVVRGVAGALPVRDSSLGAVLSVTVFEFLPDPSEVMREVARVLRPGGRFVLGFFPRTSAWAVAYEAMGSDPGSVFHGARFYSGDDIAALGAGAGLRPIGARSTLFEAPGVTPSGKVVDGAQGLAGFVAMSMARPSSE